MITADQVGRVAIESAKGWKNKHLDVGRLSGFYFTLWTTYWRRFWGVYNDYTKKYGYSIYYKTPKKRELSAV